MCMICALHQNSLKVENFMIFVSISDLNFVDDFFWRMLLFLRYANALRLEHPVMETNWNQDAPFQSYVQCPQFAPAFNAHAEESEDCLRIHIYTPKGSKFSTLLMSWFCFTKVYIWDLKSLSLPVFFHIHGGGFIVNNGAWPSEGYVFTERNAIFVPNISWVLAYNVFFSIF